MKMHSRHTRNILVRLVRLVLLISISFSALLPPLFAQNAGQDPAHVKLAATVHLNLGVTTADKLMAELSKQTGITIKTADYLHERILTVRMDNLTAEAVLAAIDELNDWTWSNVLPDQVLVTRRRLSLAGAAAAIPRMMQAAIPKDIRTCLSFPTPTDDLTKYVYGYSIHDSLADHLNSFRNQKTVATDQAELLISLAPGILSGDRIPYEKMTPLQRSQLLISLVFPLLGSVNNRFLHGDALPHVADVKNTVIKLNGNSLFVGSHIHFDEGNYNNEVGYGVEIH